MMGKSSKLSPCTNHPLLCPHCKEPIWSWSLEAHWKEEAHPGNPPQEALVAEQERQDAIAWKIGKGVPVRKEGKGRKRNRREASPESADEADGGDDEPGNVDMGVSASTLHPPIYTH
mmetsp:Transcript_49486/g.88437  ORF Transcript_49486/g.88437 Transcript_49486/m.88437 type:complete len:117 (-) Transcript_49486:111-461(-)